MKVQIGNLLRIPAFCLALATATACGAERAAPSAVEGCYEPTKFDSGELRITTFKDLLLLADAARSPRFVAISGADEKGDYEFSFFDSQEVKERYRISPERNEIIQTPQSLTFSVSSRGLGEGGSWKAAGLITLSIDNRGNLYGNADITTETRDLIFFTKKEQIHLSFELKRVADCNVKSLTIVTNGQDLMGPGRPKVPRH